LIWRCGLGGVALDNVHALDHQPAVLRRTFSTRPLAAILPVITTTVSFFQSRRNLDIMILNC
jgi:hypothetical protein